ncbi:hypothetical protein [Spirosoma areae]
MNPLRLLSLVILLASAACSTNPATHQGATTLLTEKEKAFRQFRQKFRVLSVPLTVNTTGNFSPETFPEINPNSTDTLFVNNPDTPSRCFGMLPDTTQYYGLIWLAPAEIYQVVLSTFTKAGDKISERQVAVGGCGEDCGFSCSETLLIRPDYTIYSTDSVSSSRCNEAGNIIPGTTRKYIKMMAGKVKPTGKIELSAVTTIARTNAGN